MAKHRIAHDQFSQLAVKLVKAAPPCMSSTDDWEPTAAALEELNLSLEHDNPAAVTPLPDASGRPVTLYLWLLTLFAPCFFAQCPLLFGPCLCLLHCALPAALL